MYGDLFTLRNLLSVFDASCCVNVNSVPALAGRFDLFQDMQLGGQARSV